MGEFNFKEGIYIHNLWHDRRHDFDHSNVTTSERRPYYPNEVWIELADIPLDPPPQSAWPGTAVGVVTGVSGVTLMLKSGTTTQYEATAPVAPPGVTLENAVSPNYSDGDYEPTLYDAGMKQIPYDPRVWVLDSVQAVVDFPNGVPSEFSPPFTFDYWYYTGAIAGEGADITADNVGTGAGLSFRDKTFDVLHFRTLKEAGSVGISTLGDEITITSTAEANTGSNLGGGAKVFKHKVLDDFEFRTITGGPDITITEGDTEINIDIPGGVGEDNTGANVGGGEGLSFRDETLDTLNFRTLKKDGPVSIVTAGDLITIGSTAEANTGTNFGAGAEVFRIKTGVDFEFRRVNGGAGIMVTQNPDDITISAAGGGTGLSAPWTFYQRETTGTHGGVPAALTWNIRVLNFTDPNSNAALDVRLAIAPAGANQLLIMAGTYYVTASAPSMGVEETKIRLQDVTIPLAPVTILVGTSEHTRFRAAPANLTQIRSFINGTIVVAAPMVLQLEHWTKDMGPTGGGMPPGNRVQGLGVATGAAGSKFEYYTEISFFKV